MFDKKEYNKNYRHTKRGKMNIMITKWKKRLLKCESRDDYELVYFTWLNSSRCDNCKCEYSKSNKKCMDHNHDTGLFRNILCFNCNVNLKCNNKSGIPNIGWFKLNNTWIYSKMIKGKQYTKYSKDLEWLKNYKKEFELKHIYTN